MMCTEVCWCPVREVGPLCTCVRKVCMCVGGVGGTEVPSSIQDCNVVLR